MTAMVTNNISSKIPRFFVIQIQKQNNVNDEIIETNYRSRTNFTIRIKIIKKGSLAADELIITAEIVNENHRQLSMNGLTNNNYHDETEKIK